MIDEGATSFWEGYDPSWPKTDFHAHLQADDGTGYFVSLAHGWSSGPTVWLTEQILGVRPEEAGFRVAAIRPDLAGLEWASGTVPTPSGPIRVRYEAHDAGMSAEIELPSGVTAEASMPVCPAQSYLIVNGKRATGKWVESGSRLEIELRDSSHFDVRCGR
jgi:alpha-L-rhamnosidase